MSLQWRAARVACSPRAAVSPGVYVYQITDTGLAATLTVAGTKFFKDAAMN